MSNALNMLEQFEIEEIEQEQKETFKIKNLEEVSWAFRKIKAYKAKKAEVEALAKAEFERVQKWLDHEVKGIESSIGFFEGLLTQYAVEQKALDPKFKCSTPYGSVSFRRQQPKWEYQDEEVLRFLKESGYTQFVRVNEEVNKADLKKAVSVANGKAVTEAGEIIEGISVIDQGEAITIKVVE